MTTPSTLLGGMSPEKFLRTTWQKKPLLVRGALPGFKSVISPEELAGIACEEDADARLVLEKGGAYPWELRHGPFEEEDFLSLPPAHWTLLVQEVDRWVPEIAQLLRTFRFIPNWRIDDVMVSYAPDGGSVGAHIDNYDVFLLQADGRREWRISTTPVENENLVPGLDVAILSDFETDETWVLEAGDLLYLPPRIPHLGIAVGGSLTYSIGFRAPSHEDLLIGFLNHVVDGVDPLARYGDPDLSLQPHPGLISRGALNRVRDVIRSVLAEEAIDRWFGTFVTEPKRTDFIDPPEEPWRPEDVVEAIDAGKRLERIAPTRYAYIETDDGGAVLFVHGREIELAPAPARVAPLVTGPEPLNRGTLGAWLDDPDVVDLLADLVNGGHLEVVDAE